MKKLDLARENQLKAIKYYDYYCKMKNIKKSEVVHNRLKFKNRQLRVEMNAELKRSTPPSTQEELKDGVKSPVQASEIESRMYIQNHEFTPKNSSRQMDEDLANQMGELVLNERLVAEKKVSDNDDLQKTDEYDETEEPVNSDLTESELKDRLDESNSNIKIIRLAKKEASVDDENYESGSADENENERVSMHAEFDIEQYRVQENPDAGQPDDEEKVESKKPQDPDADEDHLVEFGQEIERRA